MFLFISSSAVVMKYNTRKRSNELAGNLGSDELKAEIKRAAEDQDIVEFQHHKRSPLNTAEAIAECQHSNLRTADINSTATEEH